MTHRDGSADSTLFFERSNMVDAHLSCAAWQVREIFEGNRQNQRFCISARTAAF
jgi:hypothetical protein